MATREFPIEPRNVPRVETSRRRIVTPIPVPESVPLLRKMREAEPRSMGGQPPVIWSEGEGCLIRDPYGNQWIDFSSGVLVTAAGHGHPRIVEAIQTTAAEHMYHAYCFPTEIRQRLVSRMTELLPHPLKRVFLLTTGSEATEAAIKLAKTRGLKDSADRRVIVTFDNAFHGRTMGAQLAGGSPALKRWLGGGHPDFVQVPYPDGYRCPDTRFEVFVESLERKGVSPRQVAGVMSETYQGCNASLMPREYTRRLREWCDRNGALLIFDEVQAGFGRTGKMFGFQHCGVVPDIACFGKGISGGMPLSAVAGTAEVMDMYGPGEMTSTHSANPVCAAAALANMDVIVEEDLAGNASRLEELLLSSGKRMMDASQGLVGRVDGRGLVMAVQFVQPGTKDPNPDLAFDVVVRAVARGVMLFCPVGVGGGAIKVNPPLVIDEPTLVEGLGALEEAVEESVRAAMK